MQFKVMFRTIANSRANTIIETFDTYYQAEAAIEKVLEYKSFYQVETECIRLYNKY